MKLKNPEVRIESTNLCNDNCSICPREMLTRPHLIMSFPAFVNIADQAIDIGAEYFCLEGFGEPLIDPMLEEKIRHVAGRGKHAILTTNARTLSKERAFRLLDAGLRDIRFSVYRLDAGRLLRILDFVEINQLTGGRCRVGVSVIMENPAAARSLQSMLRDEVDYLEVWRPHNWAYGRQYRPLTERRRRTCGRPENGPIQISAAGDVGVCCFDFDFRMSVGDVFRDRLVDIIRGDAFERIREKHRSGDLPGLPCEACDQLNVENESPLIYSSRDPDRRTGKTSILKIDLHENQL